MRRWLRPLWVLLALIFLIEAWLWDHLQPVVARVVAWIPLHAIKAWIAEAIRHLSPPLTLIVFAVPFIVLAPVGLLEGWLLAHKSFIAASAVMVAHKVIGVGLIAFVFDVTRDKLLQMPWFRRLYDFVIDLRARAHALVAPIMARIKAVMARLRVNSAARWLRMVRRLRRRAQSAR